MKIIPNSPLFPVLRRTVLALASITLAVVSAQATTIVKASNTTALNATGSWVGGAVPGSGDTAQWNNTLTAANSSALGGSLTWGQILISDPGGAITISNTASATLTLNGLGSPLTGIDMSTAAQNLTISNGLLALGASQTWNVGASRTLTVSGAISGSSLGITKDGAGTLSLTGANTFTGGINVSAGTLSVNSMTAVATANPLGQSSASASNLLLGNGTTLQNTGASKTTDRLFTINGTANGDSATLDFSNSGSSAFGNGRTTFTGIGALAYGVANQTRTLNLTGTCTYAGSLAAAIGDNGTGVVSVTKNGPGVFALIGNNTFSGGATVNTGVLSIGKTQARGTGTVTAAATGSVTLGVGTGGYTNANVDSLIGNSLAGFSLDSAAGAGIDTTIGAVSYALPSSVTRPFVKVGHNTLTLTGNSTYGGPVKVYSGTLAVGSLANGGSASPLGQSSNAAGNLALDGGSIQFNGSTSTSTDRGFTVYTNGATLDASGSGTASLTWSGSPAYDVPDVIRTLTLVGGSATGVSNVLSGQITDNGTGKVSLNKSGTNTWSVTNSSNSFTGGVSFNGGFLQFASGALGTSGKIFIASNTVPPFGLRWLPGNTDDISARFNDTGTSAFCTLDTGANDVVFASAIAMRADSWLIKDGSGSLTLNTASGWGSGTGAATLINNGMLVAKVLANGGTNSSIGNIPNAAIALGLRGGTLKYTGSGVSTDHNFHLSGNNTIDASGTGAVVFSQTAAISPTPAARSFGITNNSKTTGNAPSSSADLVPGMFVGGTGITAGTKIVSIGINGQLTFDQNATSTTTSSISFGSYAAGTLTLTGTNTGANEIKGILQDSVSAIDASVAVRSLSKTGNGKWVLSGANTYTGTTSVDGGTLQITGSLSASSAVTVNSGGTLGGTGTINGPFTLNGGTLSLGSSAATFTLASATSPSFAVGSALKIAAASSSLDKLSLTNSTPTFACGNLNLVVDTTGLAAAFSNVEIVHTANAAGVTGNFANVTVIGDTSYYAVVNYAGNSITLSLTQNPAAAGAYRIQVSGSSSVTANAGDSLALTVTALNLAGTTLTSLNSDVPFSFYGLASSPNSNAPVVTDKNGVSRAVTVTAGTPNTTLTFVNGVATVSGSNNGLLTAYKTGTAALHCTDGTVTSAGGTGAAGLSLTVNPLALASYTVTASSPQATGLPFLTTVNAVDNYGNTVTSDSSTVVTMTSSGSAQFDSNGDSTFGDNTKTLSGGILTISTTDNVAESMTLTATSAGGKTGTSSSITVTASSANDILTFTFPTYGAANISGTSITITVPFGTSVSSLAPTYTVSAGATGSPVSGTARDFTNPQSYTITALDNSTKNYTVTVTVAPQATVFTWASAADGNWSSASNWTNNLSDGTSPAATGYANYTLNFTPSGTYTATNDLNNGFLLNQANFAGAVTLAGTNGITFTNNGVTLPAINQNSSSTINLNAPVSMAADLTIGGTGSGRVNLNGVFSGGGKLIKSFTNRMDLFGTNTYTGGTVVNGGSLQMGSTSNSLLGTGTVTVNSGATLGLNGNNNLTNAFAFNSASVINGNSFSANLNGPVTLTGSNSFDLGTTGGMSIGGVISGTGGIVKKGTSGGQIIVTGNNTFSGTVSIQAGNLSVSSLNSISGGTSTSNLGAPITVSSGTISFGSTTTGGTLIYTGNGETTDRVIQLAGTTGGATITQGGNAYLTTTRGQTGLLKFTSDLSIPGTASVDNRKTLTLTHAPKAGTGATTGQGEISGSIGDSLLGTSGQTATSIVKAGSSTWILSGANTYSGSTKVQAGTLAITRSDALGSGALDITAAARLRLGFLGTRQVSALTFDNGSAQPNGTYGSSASLATYKDDTRFSGSGTVTVGPLPSSPSVALALSSGSSPSSGGAPLTFTATVTGSQPTGYIYFYDGLTQIGAGTLNGSYQAAFTTSVLAGGSHTITAVYPGDSNNGPGYSNSMTQNVNDTRTATTTVLALTSGANPSAFGASVTFTATVTGASPAGTVAFYDGGTLLGSSTLNGSGQASLTASGLAVGWRSITATYLGDNINAPSTTATAFFQTVNPSAGNGKLKVFILAGQSNMQGKGMVEKGRDPNNYNNTNFVGGLGSLRSMLNRNPNTYGYLADSSSIANTPNTTVPGWRTLPNVWVSYFTSGANASATQARKGYLDADFGNGASSGQIGPEYGFGLAVGSQLSDPVLIIKTAWGGNSLAWNFRPPSSGTTTLTNINTMRDAYNYMVADVHYILNNLGTELTNFSYNPANGYEIVGFGWHQGWNDRGSAGATAEYEANMANLIKDLRTEFGVPNLPFVIGTTSMSNVDSDTLGLQLVAAQKAVANPSLHPEFAGTVTTIDTKTYDYGTDASPSSEGFHWNWNAESYFNIGEKMGQAMVGLLSSQSSAKDILTFTVPGQTSSIISGNTITVTVPTGTNVTSLMPTFTLSLLATATPVSGVARNFTAPQTYTVTAQNLSTKTYTVTVTVSSSPYADWASNPAQGLTLGVNDGPLMDPDFDGISNLLEFVLGGVPMISSRSVMPTLKTSGGQWQFAYDRSHASLPPATTQIVQYSSDMANWNEITVTATSSGSVAVTPGAGSDHVVVTVPSLGSRMFVRLKAAE